MLHSSQLGGGMHFKRSLTDCHDIIEEEELEE
jgi:hypothetical protein